MFYIDLFWAYSDILAIAFTFYDLIAIIYLFSIFHKD